MINVYLDLKYMKKEIDKMSEKEKKSKNVNENFGFNLFYNGEIDEEKIVKNFLVYFLNIFE